MSRGAAGAALLVALAVFFSSSSEGVPGDEAAVIGADADTGTLARPGQAGSLPRTSGRRDRVPRPRAAPAHPPAEALHVGRIEIPAIGVSARVVALGLNPDGTLQVPARADEAGWWSGGRALGTAGPTVIAGHVDSRTGPGVFSSLRHLRRGQRIVVSLRGRRRSFRVDSTSSHPKRAFPTELVYRATTGPALRLITCDGPFDGHSYARNLIVFARPGGVPDARGSRSAPRPSAVNG